MRVFTSKHEPIELAEKPFASGGEGAVFKVKTASRHLKESCVKLYHVSKKTSNREIVKNREREERIKYMVNNPPSAIRGENFMIGWPMDWVTNQQGIFIGFVMPMGFTGSKELVNLTATTLNKKLGQEWQERYDRSLGKKALLSRLKLICNIAIPVHILHSTGKYVLRDFKPQNVLVTSDGKVTIVDMDSIQISVGNKLLYRATAHTPDYVPPEFYNLGVGKKECHLISQSWDMFAVGVVFYQLLFGLHPYTITPIIQQDGGENSTSQNISSNLFPFGRNAQLIAVRPPLHDKFNVLPKNIRDLFVRTFTDDIGNRPTAESWGRIIHKVVIEAEKTIGAVDTTYNVSDETATSMNDSNRNSIKNISGTKKDNSFNGVVNKSKIANPSNDMVSEENQSRLGKWKYCFHAFQICSALVYAFLPNVYRWNHWAHLEAEDCGVEPTLWLFWLPIVLSWLNNDLIDKKDFKSKQSLNTQFSSWSWIAMRSLLCIALAIWVCIDYIWHDGYAYNSYFDYDYIIATLLGPILCGMCWCVAILCLCKMQKIVSNL